MLRNARGVQFATCTRREIQWPTGYARRGLVERKLCIPHHLLPRSHFCTNVACLSRNSRNHSRLLGSFAKLAEVCELNANIPQVTTSVQCKQNWCIAHDLGRTWHTHVLKWQQPDADFDSQTGEIRIESEIRTGNAKRNAG